MPPEPQKKYYLTTPIYYVNARPHIGHAYTTIVADVLARRHRLLGDDVFFLTGTDEHGQKIERSAAAAGIPPQQFADGVSAEFQKLWDRMGLTYNKFIRTTDAAHAHGVQKLFTELYNRGSIYLSTYTGAYCVSDEAFVDVPVGAPCPDCGRLTEQVTEENFFFCLSEFQRPLLDLIESGILKVEPETRRNEVLSFLRGDVAALKRDGSVPVIRRVSGKRRVSSKEDLLEMVEIVTVDKPSYSAAGHPYVDGALQDLSVSRSSFTWGIPVPKEVQRRAGATQNHIVYVWLDALANYITAVGYGDPSESGKAEFAKWWPADLHLVGKEIIRFHCVYWPAFLLALNPSLQHTAMNDVILSEAKDDGISPAATLTPAPQLTFEQHRTWAEKMLPKAVTAHGWLLFDNSKMSKSKGNIVRTETILQAFGTLCPPVHVTSDEARSGKGTASAVPSDATTNGALAPEVRPATLHERDLFASDVLRYFLLREIPFGQDGSFSFDALITRYNADLANGFGNLVSRTLAMIQKYFDGQIPKPSLSIPEHEYAAMMPELHKRDEYFFHPNSLPTFGYKLIDQIKRSHSREDFAIALNDLWSFPVTTDAVISAAKPWKRNISDDREQQIVATTLYFAAESIRVFTAALHPYLPYATARVWAQLGLGDIEQAAASGKLKNLEWGGLQPGTKLGPLAPIFPRADKGLAQIMTDLENSQLTSPATTPQDPSSVHTSNPVAERNPTRPDAPLKQAFTPTPAAPVVTDPTHPAAPPAALDSLAEPSGTLPVAGSHATTTATGPTPSHREIPASGIFAQQTPGPSTLSPDASPQITIDDFAKVELRVAEIKVCERIPKADKLLRLEVDLGHETRQILSGIAEFYTPEDLIGRRIIVITNLAPRKMRGLDSHGMLLAASGPDGGKPILATVPEGVPLGSRLK